MAVDEGLGLGGGGALGVDTHMVAVPCFVAHFRDTEGAVHVDSFNVGDMTVVTTQPLKPGNAADDRDGSCGETALLRSFVPIDSVVGASSTGAINGCTDVGSHPSSPPDTIAVAEAEVEVNERTVIAARVITCDTGLRCTA